MTNVGIVTDSPRTVEKNIRDTLGTRVMPLSIMIDGTVYPDNDQLNDGKFMEMMAKTKNLPKTSRPPIGKFISMYDELREDGNEVTSTRMAKGLNGTTKAARQASSLAKTKVMATDSDTTDRGSSFQIVRIAELAKEGRPIGGIPEGVRKA